VGLLLSSREGEGQGSETRKPVNWELSASSSTTIAIDSREEQM
jgi:hypothetical protein